MTKQTAPNYSRAPSPCLRKLLAKGGFLAPLISLSGKPATQDDLPLDVHLRRNDEVHVYCGGTRLVAAKRKKNQRVDVWADKTYENQERERRLFRDWKIDESGFREALKDYLKKVKVADRYIAKEGRLQALWSRVTMPPWTPFDREAVLGYDDEGEKKTSRDYKIVTDAHSKVKDIAAGWRRPWANIPTTGGELDQLAVDGEGNLVFIEIKYAARGYNAAQVYYAPLQLLQYIHEWNVALQSQAVLDGLQKLVEARVELDLMPSVPKLSGEFRAAVCFGRDKRSEEVKNRYCEVLSVVNSHLPNGVRPVETWALPIDTWEPGDDPKPLPL